MALGLLSYGWGWTQVIGSEVWASRVIAGGMCDSSGLVGWFVRVAVRNEGTMGAGNARVAGISRLQSWRWVVGDDR